MHLASARGPQRPWACHGGRLKNRRASGHRLTALGCWDADFLEGNLSSFFAAFARLAAEAEARGNGDLAIAEGEWYNVIMVPENWTRCLVNTKMPIRGGDGRTLTRELDQKTA